MGKLTDEQLADLRRTFDTCDTNGDGFIGFKEFVVWWTS